MCIWVCVCLCVCVRVCGRARAFVCVCVAILHMTRREGLLRVILWCHGSFCTNGDRTDVCWHRKIEQQIVMIRFDFRFEIEIQYVFYGEYCFHHARCQRIGSQYVFASSGFGVNIKFSTKTRASWFCLKLFRSSRTQD